MATCRLCEHCHGQVQGDHPVVRNGYSYHKDCLKCYVCSETDLRNAEVFKGVIFCRSCTQRIFASCATVREDKRLMGQRGDEAWGGRRGEPRRRVPRTRTEQRGCNLVPQASNHDYKVKKFANTSTSSLGSYKTSMSFTKTMQNNKDSGSVDIGVATEVTQTLLDAAFNDSLVMMEYIQKLAAMYTPPQNVNPKLVQRKFALMVTIDGPIYAPTQNRLISDELRMAELGASTEIANMALQGLNNKVAEFPQADIIKSRPAIIIKSSRSNEEKHSSSADRPQPCQPKRRNRRHVSMSAKSNRRPAAFRQTDAQSRLASAKSKACVETLRESFHSADTSLPLRRDHPHDNKHHKRRNVHECASSDLSIGDVTGVMKIPYKLFKKNIIRRSSIMSYLSLRRHHNESFEKERKRNLYRNSDVYSHQRQGLRILYAAINHKKTPYKLGWLDLKSKTSCCIKSGDCMVHPPRCRHYRRSHTYRCMRRKVMKMAGPTKDQLAELRGSIFRKILPTQVANFLSYMSRYANTTTKSIAVPTESIMAAA